MYKRTALNKLIEWKEKPNRKPLIIRGARQVGKTTLVKMFAREFDFFINLNLEKSKGRRIFEDHDDLDTILSILFLEYQISKSNDQYSVLIFIDEIQNSPKAVAFLRYFYEEKKELFVIAAGSLLESILDKHISFPVGRVEYLILRPFSFKEYLSAKGREAELDLILNAPFPDFAHDRLLQLFNEYALIGGMPEIVSNYLEFNDLVVVGEIFDGLISTYLEDVEKYSKNDKQTKIIRHIISNSIKLAGERIKFEGFAQSNYRSRDVSECFRILGKTFFLQLVYPVTSTKIPLVENMKKSPRLHVLDTGMVNKYTGAQVEILSKNRIDMVFKGKIAEHIAGQELLSEQTGVLNKNNFWVKEKKQSNAEVDYILQIGDLIIPVEIKSGKTGRLRSLMEFIDLAPHNFAVRVYSGKLSVERAKTIRDKSFYLLNLPFYLLSGIREYIVLMINNKDKIILNK